MQDVQFKILMLLKDTRFNNTEAHHVFDSQHHKAVKDSSSVNLMSSQ